MSLDPNSLAQHPEILEDIEKASTRMVCQAIWDAVDIAAEQFRLAKDLQGTVGEDVTRDALETMGLSRIPTARLIGKIDYKRAAYYFHPAYSVRQALFVDSKAERGDPTSATIQISQTSLRVRMGAGDAALDEPGRLDKVLSVGGERYLVTTLFVKYRYSITPEGDNRLEDIYVVCLPNGMLQQQYNPSNEDSIWRVGRHAPSRGEEFRVRISFPRLKTKRGWRVQTIGVAPHRSFEWDDDAVEDDND